jgi:hypothetical protein
MARDHAPGIGKTTVIALCLLGLLQLTVTGYVLAYAPDRNKAQNALYVQLSEIRSMKGDVALSSVFFLKPVSSGLSQSYQSQASPADIHSHYIQEFSRLGWHLAAEHTSPAHTSTLTFEKGNLTATVDYPGKAIAKPWDYLITLTYHHEPRGIDQWFK